MTAGPTNIFKAVQDREAARDAAEAQRRHWLFTGLLILFQLGILALTARDLIGRHRPNDAETLSWVLTLLATVLFVAWSIWVGLDRLNDTRGKSVVAGLAMVCMQLATHLRWILASPRHLAIGLALAGLAIVLIAMPPRREPER